MKVFLTAIVLAGCTNMSGNPSTHTPVTGAIAVYCVGDSDTYGIVTGSNPPTSDLDSYRKALSDALQADIVAGGIPPGVLFTFVGPIDTGHAPANHHDGIVGRTTWDQFVITLGQSSVSAAPNILIPLHIGLNDAVGAFPDPAGFPLGYLSLVRRLHNLYRGQNPRFVFSILQVQTQAQPAGDPTIASLNAELPGLWFELAREGIEFETISWNLPGNFTHLTQAQYDAMGNGNPSGFNYHEAVRAVLGYPLPP